MILARASQIIDCILQRYHKTRKNALFSWQPLDIRAKERDLSQKKKNKKKRAISNDENKINNNNSNDNSNINNNNIKMLTILMILINNFS